MASCTRRRAGLHGNQREDVHAGTVSKSCGIWRHHIVHNGVALISQLLQVPTLGLSESDQGRVRTSRGEGNAMSSSAAGREGEACLVEGIDKS